MRRIHPRFPLSTSRLVSGLAAAAAASSLVLAPALPAHADGADAYGRNCDPDKYKDRYKVDASKATVRPTITYQASYQLAPGERWTTSREITLVRQKSVSADMSFSSTQGGGASAGIAKVISVDLKAEFGLTFQTSGNLTTTRQEKTFEERSFANPDQRANHKVIFYKGTTTAEGRVNFLSCRQHFFPGQSYGPFEVHKYFGTFQTWTDNVGLSHVICGYPADGELARLVKQKYCKL